MAYKIEQFNQPFVKNGNVSNDYMKSLDVNNIYTLKVESNRDVNILSNSSIIPFYDEAISLENSKFNVDTTYYLQGKILRLENTQVFRVFLINTDKELENELKQYIIELEIASTDKPNDWIEFQIVFNPIVEMNTVLFQLKRERQDYISPRNSCIVYEDISEILNYGLQDKICDKIGVQSRPGLKMCINNEEIHIGKSGIYELRNNDIKIDKFSVISRVDIENEEDLLTDIYNTYLFNSGNETTSNGVLTLLQDNNIIKTRSIDAFTLDYLYNENTGTKGGN